MRQRGSEIPSRDAGPDEDISSSHGLIVKTLCCTARPASSHQLWRRPGDLPDPPGPRRRLRRCLFAFVVVPFAASEYLLRAMLVPFLILALAAIGLNMLVGYCGQISLGTGAFMAVGAYATYNFTIRAALAEPLLVFLLAASARRRRVSCSACRHCASRAIYLAVATLAAQFFIDWAFLRIPWFTNYSSSGSVTAPPLRVLGLSIETPGRTVPVVPGASSAVTGARGEEPGARAHAAANGWRSATWTSPPRSSASGRCTPS